MKFIIYIVIGILLFITFRKIISKFFPTLKKTQDIISAVLAFLLTPLVTMGIGILVVSSILYEHHPERIFSISSWQNNVTDRHEMSNNIISSKVLLGLSKRQISEKIGLPNNNILLAKDTLSSWKYTMGSRG